MTQSFPLLPLRDIVVFPHMIVPLFVGRDRSVAALEAAMTTQHDDSALPDRPVQVRVIECAASYAILAMNRL